MLKIFKKKKPEMQREEYIENFHSGNISFDVKEAFKTVRTNIMFATNTIEGCKKIIITSSVAGEGKSTACVNLAMATAQMNSKVLLIDADLRKPTIHRFLKLDQKVGLSTALGGFSAFEDVIKKTDIGVDCIPSGPVPPNAAELLASDKMQELLEWAADKYDYILLDTPPVNIVSDATILSRYVHGTILVVRNKFTAHPSIVHALEALEFSGTKVFGFLLNDKDLTENRGYYKYGAYRYRYGKYGYAYAKSYKTGTGEKK